MKFIIFFITIIFSTSLGFAQGFEVNKLTADIYLSKDGYFDVIEKYDLNFTTAKHGIYRDLFTQFNYKDRQDKIAKKYITFSNIAVPDRNFTTNEIFGKLFSSKLQIKIGDKDKLVNGNQQYEIRYRVTNALLFSDSLAMFYWNIKPSEWYALFKKINFTIHAPDGAILSPKNCFVYAGATGDTSLAQNFDYHYAANIFSAESTKYFFSFHGQNVTVLVKLPKSLIKEVTVTVSFWQRYRWWAVALGLCLAVFIYFKMKLNANKVIAVTSYYPPKNIDPAMAGVLLDNTTDRRDLTSLFPYWATQGIIRMEAIEKGDRSLNGNLKIIKLKPLPENAAGYEHNLFSKVFSGGRTEVFTSELRGIYAEPYKLLAKKSEMYYEHSVGQRIFKRTVLFISWLWAFFSISFLPYFLKPYVDIDSGKFILVLIAHFLFFLLIFPILIAYLVTKLKSKNTTGKQIMPELLGFYEFIKMAETERLRILLAEDPTYFEKTMPYAVAFNQLKEWASKFDQFNLTAPSWYSSTSKTSFTMNSFTNSFKTSMASASMAMLSTSSGSSHSSSGGGSSGGGGGGGGGGSW